jgi:xanthine/uracil/vitamin C permease (AzgA family)
VWGVLGLVVVVLARSAAVAISIGVGYVLVFESLVKMVKGAPSDWLLGTTLGALASGGTAVVSYGTALALALALAYVTLGLVLAGVVFVRRDVTD